MTKKQLISIWEKWAKTNNLVLNYKTRNIEQIANMVVNKKGACPCLPKKRLSCPCQESFYDIALMGCCHCMLFLDPKWTGTYGVVKN